MYDSSVLVEIFQCFGNLQDDVTRKVFAKVRQTHNLVEELSTRTQLENNVVVLASFREFHQRDDVGVVELTHDLDFFEDIGTLLE